MEANFNHLFVHFVSLLSFLQQSTLPQSVPDNSEYLATCYFKRAALHETYKFERCSIFVAKSYISCPCSYNPSTALKLRLGLPDLFWRSAQLNPPLFSSLPSPLYRFWKWTNPSREQIPRDLLFSVNDREGRIERREGEREKNEIQIMSAKRSDPRLIACR